MGEKIKNVEALLRTQWSQEINIPLRVDLHESKENKNDNLPATEDIVTLSKSINERISLAVLKLKENVSEHNWRKLANVVLAHLILFNKRREGEVSRMLLSDYLKRPVSYPVNKEIEQSLSVTERALLQKLNMVKVRGKRGRHVPILLTEKAKLALDILCETRCQIVPAENPFIELVAENMASGEVLLEKEDDAECKNNLDIVNEEIKLSNFHTDSDESSHVKGKNSSNHSIKMEKVADYSNVTVASSSNDKVQSCATYIKGGSKNISQRQTWPTETKSLAFKYFAHNIKNKIPPKQCECLKFISKYKIKNRSWKDVKALIFNTYYLSPVFVNSKFSKLKPKSELGIS
ncbi:hypothetical protein Avbf_07452 [Armadillidium vulgare]|nr:hypothetical protein Avbf_07452 [Armadillidium vulgare]